MKGIILAGGKGTRLYPMTQVVSKQLLPIFDKPLIYYPLSVLLLAGIKDVLLISTPDSIGLYEKLLGDGSRLGISISYKIQEKPRGLAEAFIIGEDFIANDDVCLVLGDNVFYGQAFVTFLKEALANKGEAMIFGYPVNNPKEFGVVEFDEAFNVISIEEKPEFPKSNYAIPGLYFFPKGVSAVAKRVIPSKRGEIEITSVIEHYLHEKSLKVTLLGRGMAWLDTGTPEGMLKAAQFVETVQSMQGFYVSCIEEIAWRRGFISTEQLRALGNEMKSTAYGQYLINLCR